MFRLIRDLRFSGKTRHLVGLFAFEFLVVVLGILTAQALADWSKDRAELRDMTAHKQRADAEIARLAATAIAYRRVIPCMDERMLIVMRAASADGRIDPATLVRPVVRAMSFTALSDKTLILIADQHGPEIADRYARLENDARRSDDLVAQLASGWQSLSIISPEAGQVGSGDRQEARIVASRMRSTLRTLDKASQNIVGYAGALGLEPKLDPGRRIPNGCADLWRWNSILYDPEDVPANREKVGPDT
jgi:hypothetical protein